MSAVFTKTYEEMPFSVAEIARYAGIKGDLPSDIALTIEDCISEIRRAALTYKVCFAEYPITRGDGLDLTFARVRSADLAKNLRGCESIILFAASVGINMDRLILKYSKTAPSRALIMQAAGAERIEALCDAFCADMEKEACSAGFSLAPRFSAGYGDLPLSLQKDIFRALECEKRIGVTLNESLLMLPTKSVTAIIGKRRKDTQKNRRSK